MEERLQAAAETRANERLEAIGPEQMRDLEKGFLLQMIDMQWREHLMHLDHLRQVIGLRGYGQRDPLNEYKTEAFSLFEKLLGDLRQNVTRWLMTVEFRFEAPPEPIEFQEVHLNPLTGENEMAQPGAQLPEGQLSLQERPLLPEELLPEGWRSTPAQHGLPVRLGPQVQALPRRVRLRRHQSGTDQRSLADGACPRAISLRQSRTPVSDHSGA
jgi:preprotein translocase subunit SecA